MERPLILLDIDNTLAFVHTEWWRRAPSFTFRLGGDCFHCYLRPGIVHFLSWLRRTYRIGIWTAADRHYASCVLRRIFGPRWRRHVECFLHRRHCSVTRAGFYVKDLRRLDEWLPNVPPTVWLVDDNAVHMRFNLARATSLGRRVLLCQPYHGHHHDTEFARVRRLLGAIHV